jgi:hypothetical protein
MIREAGVLLDPRVAKHVDTRVARFAFPGLMNALRNHLLF